MVHLTDDTLKAIFYEPGNDGAFFGQARLHLRKLGRLRSCVLLVFPPKAAGTFFRTAVIHAVDGKLVRVVHAQGGRDAQLYLPTLAAYYLGGISNHTLVSHVHMQALPANVHMLEAFDIRPIVMTRSIPDMLASYWDMLDRDPVAQKDGLNCLIPPGFPELPKAAKADFMVDIMGPWYASYFATWMAYAEAEPERVCVLRYRDFKADPAATMECALAHARLPRTREQCQEALDKVWDVRDSYRFNKGERGRGRSYFGDDHIARLRRMLGHYPNLAAHMGELLGEDEMAASRAA